MALAVPMIWIGMRVGRERENGTGGIVIETESGVENVDGGSASLFVYVTRIATYICWH